MQSPKADGRIGGLRLVNCKLKNVMRVANVSLLLIHSEVISEFYAEY